ncbi:MAG: TldD/PmbA family protein [Pseudanabaenaceae cyanobacterium SKYGB_i_bin29]|nr:TldD/PmbA family protein [Pseudanabaenaceae cyanobacterium SKYG29]MDW8421932.1 TldD/PmbA family protein [Pseudanabaenaceae cyanobacterium SKYGB_i_bin29]
MQDQLLSLLKSYSGSVDYLELRLEESESTLISFQGKELNAVDRSIGLTGGIRACYRGGWSFVTFNSLENITDRMEAAISQAQLVGKEQTQLAEVAPVVDTVKADIKDDPRGYSLKEKKELLGYYNDLLLRYDDRIQTTMTTYRDRFATTYFVNSLGTAICQERLDISGRFGVVARNGVVRQGFESLHSRSDYGVLRHKEEVVLAAAKRAIEQLEAKPVKGGQYTVILDPYLAGVFIHEAFGHLSEADFVYENPRLQEILTLGKPIANPALNVVDDATLPDLPGTMNYDDEGVPGQRKYLIKEGILTQRLHNLETAGKMQEAPTGNARVLNASYPPIVRMTNTAIEAGSYSFADMVKDIDLGVYAIKMLGGQTNGEMFTFAAAAGYMIRNGEIAEPVSDITLSGNVFQTLKDIDAIGNDTQFAYGGCGKADQIGLPVSVGGPHVRIRNVVVGGR